MPKEWNLLRDSHATVLAAAIALLLVGCGDTKSTERRDPAGPATAPLPVPRDPGVVPEPRASTDSAREIERRMREVGEVVSPRSARIDEEDGGGDSQLPPSLAPSEPPEPTSTPQPPAPLPSALESPSSAAAATATTEVPRVFPEKPRKITVYYGTNRAALTLTPWEYVWMFRWTTAILVGVLGASWMLRRILKPSLRLWSVLLLVLGIILTVWRFAETAARAIRLQEYARRVGRVYSNELLPCSEWPLETGVCEVAFPKDHKPGRIERPELQHWTIFEDPDHHVMIRSAVPVERDSFFARLGDDLRTAKSDEAFVFVHGYNTTFEDAVLRTGQIAFDLGFPGAPICFSWASYGGLGSYLPDEEHARTSALHLRRFLEDIVKKSRPSRLHLVVHSMGSRVTYDALREIDATSALSGFHFGEIVLAAPDIGVEEFRSSALPRLVGCCGTATLYASENDVALLASKEVHQMRRAGQAGATLVVDKRIETIDVSNVTRGHSYIGEDGRVIQDLGELIISRRRARERPLLEKRTWTPVGGQEPIPYWVLKRSRP